MADELNIPTHRWYQKRNHVALAKEDVSRQYIYDSGIQKIDAWINSQPWGDVYIVNRLSPNLVFDFDATYFRTDGTDTDLVSAATHTRAGNATMVDSDGLLKWAPHNLLTYSEDFTNAGWADANLTRTTTSISCDANTNNVTYSPAPSGLSVAAEATHTAELDVQLVAGQWVTLEVWDGGGYSGVRAWFDLQNGIKGTLSATAGFVAVSSDIEALGGGYYRIKVSGHPTAADTIFWSFRFVDGDAAYNFTGVSGDSVNVRNPRVYRSDLGGMVNNPSTGDSYVPTTDSARYLPRVGHHIWNGSAWVDEGYFHESEARTNLVTYSTINAVNYSVINATLTENAATDLGGTSTSARLTGSGASEIQRLGINTTITGNSCFSWTIRKDSTHRYFQILQGSDGAFYQNFDLLSGVLGTDGGGVVNAGVIDEGDFWRIFAVFNVVTSSANYLYLAPSASAAYGQSSDTSDYADLAFHQPEAGSTPSSYIPTSGSTVTRAADTLTIPSANLPWPTPEVIGEEKWTSPTISDPDVWSWDGTTLTGTGDGTSATARGDVVTSGGVYLITYNVTRVSGLCQIRIGNSFIETVAQNGLREKIIVAGGTTGFTFTDSGSFIGTIDNISVREINPLAVSIQMEGTMTYADEGVDNQIGFLNWFASSGVYITQKIRTQFGFTGSFVTTQATGGETKVLAEGAPGSYSPGINVPFNIASRHGSTFINGAVDGTALTADTTPTALPDLSSTDMQIGYDFMGTIKLFRVWADDLTDEGIAEASTNA